MIFTWDDESDTCGPFKVFLSQFYREAVCLLTQCSQSSADSLINWHAPVLCLPLHHKAGGQRVTGCLVSSETAAQMKSRGGEQSWGTKRFYWRASLWGVSALRKAELRAVSAAPCCGLTAGWGPICVSTLGHAPVDLSLFPKLGLYNMDAWFEWHHPLKILGMWMAFILFQALWDK